MIIKDNWVVDFSNGVCNTPYEMVYVEEALFAKGGLVDPSLATTVWGESNLNLETPSNTNNVVPKSILDSDVSEWRTLALIQRTKLMLLLGLIKMF